MKTNNKANNSDMKTAIYNKGVKKVARCMALGCLLLFFFGGSLMAQTTGGQFVIKTDGPHYLSHAGNTLQDATTFSPSCLWISDNQYTQGGTNKNYYFMDGTTPRFLAATEFQAGGSLSISASQPPTSYLNNPESPYYFYKWDGGLGRGVQYYGACADSVTCINVCGHVWGDGQCWDVYWVAYYENVWKLSGKYYDLDDVPVGGAKFYPVTITEHAQDTTIVGENSGLQPLADFEMEYQADPLTTHQVTPTVNPYSYAVRQAYTTYVFEEHAHHYYNNEDHENIPESQQPDPTNASSYAWTITGDGATYLGIDDPTSATPTITYNTPNNTGHKTATLTLTVTYSDGSKQKSSATILVKTPCQNPPIQDEHAVVTFVGVTVFWDPTAVSYKVSWQKQGDSDWNHAEVGNVTSYTITGLEYETTYNYKVQATSCDPETSDPTGPYPTFTTLPEPGLMVTGAIFGGGRMADVGTETGGGNTEIVIINCDSVGVLYGGNDIAGKVYGGSKITLGVKTGDPNDYDVLYGVTDEDVSLNFSSVYGGGNGYYAYNGESFVAANSEYTSETVAAGASIKAMTDLHQVGEVVWTNTSNVPATLHFPAIAHTEIMVTDDFVTVDSIFGGAKNAFLTTNSGDGSLITINGGTVFAVFGGNNWGGGQGRGKHHIVVNKTTTNLIPNIANTATTGYGRTFGIRYLFGGGNKVAGSTTDVYINGGQLDDVFAGGNAADVYKANVTVNCEMGTDAGDHITFGKVFSNAIQSYSGGVITPKLTYGWDGINGIYNVRTLYGGNNEAEMTRLPSMTLTSGSIGTIYGGGNAGDMMGQVSGQINGIDILYGTYVEMNSGLIISDFLYGGCRMSNVANSTWVALRKGHVGNVYGGCNISGDVGSTRVNPSAPDIPQTEEDQKVKGATYVLAGGNTGDNIVVYKDLFAGSNGYYDCSTDGIHYNNDTYFDDPTGQYARLTVPTHNETNVFVSDGALIKGNVYAGGNLACVGFDDGTGFFRGFPELVGLASVFMDGGEVEQNVYGGGNMASIFGENSVRVSGGTIGVALYGGNDRAGQVAEKTNRVLPYEYTIASDGVTSLADLGVKTYVGVSGDAQIGTVYGGGNGDYPPGSIQYCHEGDNEPIQPHTFVDIHIDGGTNGGHVRTVYGGGNGVTVRHGVTVFLNVQNPVYASDDRHVDTIFGGNNKGDLVVVPDIRLVHGKVGTVYGGCNRGAMTATGENLKTVGGYTDIGSYVRLRDTYQATSSSTPVNVDAEVTQAVYGGCRMNGVTNNSLVLVEGGDFSDVSLFGGSDISGTVSGDSRVAVVGGTVGKVYGGGNGYYTYTYNNNGDVYTIPTSGEPVLVATGVATAPICTTSGADILGGSVGTADLLNDGTVAQVFGAGYGKDTETIGDVVVNVGSKVPTLLNNTPILPNIYGDIYGGSAFGDVNTDDASGGTVTTSTTVNLFNGTFHSKTVQVNGFDVHYGGNVYGGGLGRKADQANNITAIEAKEYGKVYVNVSSADQKFNHCYLNLREANIFGCNNTFGSPQDDVEVHVWRTADTIGDYNSQTGSLYAIRQVFGGGNQADYAPTSSDKRTWVYVHDCRNTINRVFSGGNAADATGVKTTIEGGRFNYVFGGGNGEVNEANIGAGGTNLLVEAGIINHLFGGSNSQGSIAGPVKTEINGTHYVPAGESVTNPCNESITEFFGGSNEAVLSTSIGIYSVIKCGTGTIGEVYGGSNQANITGDVRLDVRGGTITNAFGGSKGVQNGAAANITGNVTLNLEGGEITDAFGGSNYNGNITGNILVNVIDFGGDCGLDLTNVYGGGNVTPYTPTSGSSVVNVMHIAQQDGIRGNVFGGAKGATATVTANPTVNFGYDASMSGYLDNISDMPSTLVPDNFRAYVKGNVFGGGDLAPVSGSTEVNVFKGEIVKKLVGGGNEAGITGNTTVNISGGKLCTSTDITEVGVYGGCNTSGNVGGNVELNITGTDATQTTIGVEQVVMDSKKPVNVHGGGYGQGTSVTGNVTVTYGSLSDPESLYPKLYGDLYGGSALGNVNTNSSNSTTVNLYNGSIICISEQVEVPGQSNPVTYYYSGNVFGGGLGKKEENSNPAIAALVNGVVYVNIGKADVLPSSYLQGKVTLIGCNVYGCNNTYGSPQDEVRVHVYQTAHTPGVNGNTVQGSDYAILRVFGGGNEAHYAPENGLLNSTRKAHVYVHGCDNTIKYVYGGGNAANAVGVVTVIEGGRFDEVYGGGNGQITAANIGLGSVGFAMLAGHVNFVYRGSNKQGSIGGTPYDATPEPGYIDCGELIVDSYYFGDNEAEHYGDIINTITCEDASEFVYKYVYAGSRWATVYGDIKLTVQGGNIKYLFGGSKGYLHDNIPANVRRFPSYAELQDDDDLPEGNRKYSQSLRTHMNYNPEDASTFNTSLVGTGGNIELVIQGGTIGEVVGGCDELGNVEGKISVIVDDLESQYCPLFVGNVYGASNHTNYAPVYDQYDPSSTTALPTPKVSINRGTIGGTTRFLIDTPSTDTTFVGNVFGGGNVGNVTSNPKVVVGGGNDNDAITVKGDVYGGGDSGDVTGSPQVVVVPDKHSLSIATPTGGSIKAREVVGDGTAITVGEDTEIPLVAIPARPTSATGYAFDYWTVTGTGSSVGNSKSPHTVFTMGTVNATLSATFREVTAYTLAMTADAPAHCAGLKVYGETYTAPVWVTGNASVTVQAIPAAGYAFSHWTIVEDVPYSGASVNADFAATTIFNMGSSNATLTAHFVPVYTLTLVSSNDDCTFKVNGETYTQPITLVEDERVSLEVTPVEGFTGWTVAGSGSVENVATATTIFTMGAGNATVTANYGRSGETNNNRNSRR